MRPLVVVAILVTTMLALAAAVLLVLSLPRPRAVSDAAVRSAIPPTAHVVADVDVHNPAGDESYYRYVVLEPTAPEAARAVLWRDVESTMRASGWTLRPAEPDVYHGERGAADVTVLPLDTFVAYAPDDATDGAAVSRIPVRGPRYLLLVFSPR